MAIHSVPSSARIMRLGAPGAPSLMPTALDAVLFPRFTTVRLPVNKPSVCSCWPTTYIVDDVTSALLAPPGVGMLVSEFWLGSVPEAWLTLKIIGAVGSSVTEDCDPPHSCPQFSTYAVPPSAEKTA